MHCFITYDKKNMYSTWIKPLSIYNLAFNSRCIAKLKEMRETDAKQNWI